MTDNMKKFLEAASQDKDFTEKLTKAETPEALIALAAEKGFALTADDLKPEEAEKVSDDELQAVSGGNACACAVAGVGLVNPNKDGEEACGCGVAGIGRYTNGDVRCGCFVGGSGAGYGPVIPD